MRLTKAHEYRRFSQAYDDGVISAILAEIGPGSRTCAEIGVQDGQECNTRALVEDGWSGVMLDKHFENDRVRREYVTRDNVQSLLKKHGAAESPDVLSMDIDGNDFWVIARLGPFLPRLLVCEYNNQFGVDDFAVMPYTEPFHWDETSYFGASQKALHWLAVRLGYSLVYVESCGINMHFVRAEYAPRFELADQPVLYHHPRAWSHPTDLLGRPFIRSEQEVLAQL